jgi:hypothetical protein
MGVWEGRGGGEGGTCVCGCVFLGGGGGANTHRRDLNRSRKRLVKVPAEVISYDAGMRPRHVKEEARAVAVADQAGAREQIGK